MGKLGNLMGKFDGEIDGEMGKLGKIDGKVGGKWGNLMRKLGN